MPKYDDFGFDLIGEQTRGGVKNESFYGVRERDRFEQSIRKKTTGEVDLGATAEEILNSLSDNSQLRDALQRRIAQSRPMIRQIPQYKARNEVIGMTVEGEKGEQRSAVVQFYHVFRPTHFFAIDWTWQQALDVAKTSQVYFPLKLEEVKGEGPPPIPFVEEEFEVVDSRTDILSDAGLETIAARYELAEKGLDLDYGATARQDVPLLIEALRKRRQRRCRTAPVPGSNTKITGMFVGQQNVWPYAPGTMGGVSTAAFSTWRKLDLPTVQAAICITVMVEFREKGVWHGALYGQSLRP